MSEDAPRTHRGNCHCGAFVYEFKWPEIKAYNDCNCSICHKLAFAWLLPGQRDLHIVKGSINDLKAYTFSTGTFIYRFCPDCGITVLAELPSKHFGDRTAINARAIQKLDMWSLDVSSFDGKARPPPYEPPVYKGPEPSVEVENSKIYHGSCHCGAVTVAVKLKPLETWDISIREERIIECNCSICARAGYIWAYPRKENSVIQGREDLTYRVFNTGILRKGFCKHCGVHIFNEPNQLTEKMASLTLDQPIEQEVNSLSDDKKAFHERIASTRAINLRILNDFDCKTLKTSHADGWNDFKPEYVNP